jgi:hypothetical protein
VCDRDGYQSQQHLCHDARHGEAGDDVRSGDVKSQGTARWWASQHAAAINARRGLGLRGQPALALLEPLACLGCTLHFLAPCPCPGPRLAEAGRQGNLAWAHVVAAAAFDAVRETVPLERSGIIVECGTMQLLREQSRGAGCRAVAATDAWHLVPASGEVGIGRDQDAVHGLREWHGVGGQRVARHGTARDQAPWWPLPHSATGRQRCADARLEIRRLVDAAARDRDDAADARPPRLYPRGHGRGRSDVLAHQADGGRQRIVGHFAACDSRQQLSLCARRVQRRQREETDAIVPGR